MPRHRARDEFAEPAPLNPLIERPGNRATSCVLPGADHSFHVPARAALNQSQVNGLMLDALTGWVDASIL